MTRPRARTKRAARPRPDAHPDAPLGACRSCGGAHPDDAGDGARVCACGTRWARAPFPRARLDAAEWEQLRHMLACRAGGRCEGCERPFVPGTREPSVHHRDPRGMGGTTRDDIHALSNLVLLCGGQIAGVADCHGWVESNRDEARRRGLLVADGLDHRDVPLELRSGRRVLLDPLSPLYLTPPGGGW